MKYIKYPLIIAGMVAAATGCKKSNPGSSVSCNCNYRYIPGRDTTGVFNVESQAGVNDTTICNHEAVALDTVYGYATCTVY